jgi:hypothetical protein
MRNSASTIYITQFDTGLNGHPCSVHDLSSIWSASREFKTTQRSIGTSLNLAGYVAGLKLLGRNKFLNASIRTSELVQGVVGK